MQSSVLKSLPPEVLQQRVLAHHPLTGTVPTITVKLKKVDHDGHAVINESDFDPEQHELVDSEEVEKVKFESLGKGTEKDPAEEYTIYKSFSFQGLFFEKNGKVMLKKSVAKNLSKRFHCIWPSSEDEKVAQNSVLRDKLVRALGGELEERDPANANPSGV